MSSRRTNTTATARLKQDYMRIMKDPVPYITAAPLASNILEWRYVVKGPENSVYDGGYYHGKLVFPREFPFKPPSIYMITPNGRFRCNTRLCLSISDFHPDTWNPAWSVSTILTGLLSFMMEKSPTLGSIETSDYTRRQLAINSWEFNLKDKVFCETFPEIAQELQDRIDKRNEELSQSKSHILQGSGTSRMVNQIHPGGQNNEAGLLGGALSNIVVVVGFAAFVYAVKYVLNNVLDGD